MTTINSESQITEIKETIAGDYSHLSSVSILRHMQDVVAIAVWYLIDLFRQHKNTVENTIKNGRLYGLDWYRDMILTFQYGHDLVLKEVYIDNMKYKIPAYDEIDEEAQIVKYSDVIPQLGGIVARVAKADRTTLLTQDEKDALAEYLHKVKYPGTPIMIVNQPADQMEIEIDAVVDPQLIDSTGKGVSTTAYPVKDAIENYFESGEFGGKLNVNDFEEMLQGDNGVEGVVSVRIKIMKATTHTLINTVIYDLANGIHLFEYESEAGHFSIDPDNDLTINYLQ